MRRWGKGAWARAPHFVLVLVVVLVLENCSPRGLDLPLTRPVDIPVLWALVQRFNRRRGRLRTPFLRSPEEIREKRWSDSIPEAYVVSADRDGL
jgi:hypothetical protein